MATRRADLAAARKAAGYTQESLAAALHIDRSTVIRWEAGDYAPLPYLRPKLARLLGQTPARLAELLDGLDTSRRELSPDIDAACIWLDERLGRKFGTVRREVITLLDRAGAEFQARHARRSKVKRSDLARALNSYYDVDNSAYETYKGRIDDQEFETSILTHPEWLNLNIPLTPNRDRLRLLAENSLPPLKINEAQAVQRLAEAEALGIRLTDQPIYRLLNIEVRQGAISGRVCLSQFLEYALTMDLLEGEILDALAENRAIQPGSLALRDQYLPTLDSVVRLDERLCVGGVLALFAITDPASAPGKVHHLVLTQERSSQVVNGTRRISVIPKGFHQPLNNYRSDTSLRASLLRELEEELFGREELDTTSEMPRTALPMHPTRMSKPMQWLTAEVSRLRVESTGFGLNLINGNYEIAALILTSNPEFWVLFGGHLEGNWEARKVNVSAAEDPFSADSWCDEGLFAFRCGLQGILAPA